MPNVYSTLSELRVAERHLDFSLPSLVGLSALRNQTTVAGSGSVTLVGSEYSIASGATASSTAVVDTIQRVHHVPGEDTFVNIGLRVPALPTGEQDGRWGAYDADEGFGFGVDATGPYVFSKTGGTVTKVYQANWNVDKLDGSGASSLTLDLTKGYLFQIQYTWFAGTEFSVVIPDATGQEKVIVAHRLSGQQPIVLAPYLPVRTEVLNGATTSNFAVAVSLRAASHVGSCCPSTRSVSHLWRSVGLTAGTPKTVFSIRRKTTGVFPKVPVILKHLSVLSNLNLEVAIIAGATLDTASWGAPNGKEAGESALEVDTTDNSATGGALQYRFLVAGNRIIHREDFPAQMFFPYDSSVLSIVATPFQADAIGAFDLRWDEAW